MANKACRNDCNHFRACVLMMIQVPAWCGRRFVEGKSDYMSIRLSWVCHPACMGIWLGYHHIQSFQLWMHQAKGSIVAGISSPDFHYRDHVCELSTVIYCGMKVSFRLLWLSILMKHVKTYTRGKYCVAWADPLAENNFGWGPHHWNTTFERDK